jgi:CDP-diacylglycerol--glycerol-3-phosphate 3-phosphatidyltransferase
MTLPVPRLRAKALANRLLVGPLARLLLALHIPPNILTLAGFAVTVVAAYFISEAHLLAGGLVLLGGSAMDILDGAVARLGNKETRFGAFLDSVTDRLGEAAALFGLLVFYVRQDHELGAYLAFGAVVISLMVSYLRARAEGLGIPGDVGLMGRPERIVVLVFGLVVGFPLYALGVLLTFATITMGQRIWHVYAAQDDS